MNIAILPSARDDLADGFDFYERQGEGLGAYFLESLFADIESLRLYVFSGRFLDFTGFCRSTFRTLPTTTWKVARSGFGLCWIAGKTRSVSAAA